MDDASMFVGGMELLLWSDDPLARTPTEPSAEVDRAADAMEIQPLQIMGVLEIWGTIVRSVS
jgi:hypothetical protein